MLRNDYVYTKKNELYHHGILGMKWGVRRYQNYDGSLTPAGRSHYGYKEIDERIRESRYNEDISDEVFKKSGADKNKLKQAKEEVKKYKDVEEEITKEVNDMFKGMTSDEDTKKFYEAASETAAFMDGGYYDKNNFTMSDLGWSTFMGTYEDGQQSRINAYSMYADEKGLKNKVEKLSTMERDAYKNRIDAAKSIVNESLKEIGMEEVNSVNVSSRLVNQIENSMDNWNKHGGSYILRANAEEVSTFDKGAKDDIKKAKEWCSKIDKDKRSWWYLNEAVEELGLGSKKCDDMTQADWDRINAKIKELRKDW